MKKILSFRTGGEHSILYDVGNSLLLCPSGRRWSIRVARIPDGHEFGNLEGHRSWINAICVVPSIPGSAFSCSSDATIRLWDLDRLTCVRNVCDNAQVRSLSFDNQRRVVFSGGDDAYGNRVSDAILWDATSLNEIGRIPLGTKIMSVLFRPTRTQLVVSVFGSLRIYDTRNVRTELKQISRIGLVKRGGIRLCDCPEDGLFLTTSYGNALRAWRDDGELAWELLASKRMDRCCVFYRSFEDRLRGPGYAFGAELEDEADWEERTGLVVKLCTSGRVMIRSEENRREELGMTLFAWLTQLKVLFLS